MSDKVTSVDVKAWLPKSKAGNLYALGSVVHAWDTDALRDARIYTAAMGIGYAVNTSRVSGLVAESIKGMSRARFAALVARVANECSTIGEVPRWLINNVKTGEQG